MQVVEIPKGTGIFQPGDRLNKLIFILKGTVRVSYPGGSYILRSQDVVGLLDASNREVMMEYVAMEKCSVVEYPYGEGKLPELLEKNKDLCKFSIKSMFHQLNDIMGQHKLLKNEYESMRGYLSSIVEDMNHYCELTGVTLGEVPDVDDNPDFIPDDNLPAWMPTFYFTMEDLIAGNGIDSIPIEFFQGLSSKSTDDVMAIINNSTDMDRIKSDMVALLINENSTDILERGMSLYHKMVKKFGIDDANCLSVYRMLEDIVMQTSSHGLNDYDWYQNRIESYKAGLKKAESISAGRMEQAKNFGEEQMKKVAGSLRAIISYSGVEEELAHSFIDHVESYKKSTNRNGSDDESRHLRQAISKEFTEIYVAAFLNSVKDSDVPLILKMFFNFGYVDEELSGIENAVYLYNLVDNLSTDPNKGVYSYYEWLLAIYHNEKDPGRDEFDVDLAEYLHEEAHNQRITKDQEAKYFKDPKTRIRYELEKVFPVINKTTTGRISTFCPLFSEHNVLKNPEDMLVTVDEVVGILNEICAIDKGAYYRQAVYSNPDIGINTEYIEVEVRPDVILAPNIGNRGIMWQEIEGKRRTTPARMFVSIFMQEELKLQLMKLTGQFRWEMCKRVQGARWNDVTDKSLTSEYFDYIQYFRKNKDLTAEAKEKIKNDLSRSKNSFREMFIRDYVTWIMYEAAGSPRMNKVVRGILMEYVPFAKDIRSKLAANPMYTSIVERYETKQKAKIHRMDNMVKKIQNSGADVPDEIYGQIRYLNS